MLANKQIIESLRKKFLKLCETDRSLFHENDIRNISENDWPIERFVLVNSTEDKALKALTEAMKWRKSFGIHNFNDQYFPLEIYKISQVVPFGRDIAGRPLLWFIIRNHFKCAELDTLLRQFSVYQIEKIDRQVSHQGWAYVNDTSDAGVANIDVDYPIFLSVVLQNYFPRSVKYIIGVEIPWILSAPAKIMRSFMNEELKNIMKFIKKEELTEYMSADEIPTHLGGNNSQIMNNAVPDGVKTLNQFTGNSGFTGKQIAKIYATYKCLNEN